MKKPPSGLSWRALLSFLFSLVLCIFLISAAIINKINIERMQIEQLVLEISVRINEVFSRILFEIQTISAGIVHENGGVEDFDKIASVITANDPDILYILAAPDGIVSKVYPLDGNKDLIGWNLFSEDPVNKEARAAKDLGALVLGGPFDMAEGGLALAGRMPVYIDTPEEKQKNWGLVSVALRFPEALEGTEIEILKKHSFIYELWRINPDTGEKQIIVRNTGKIKKNVNFSERIIHAFNADWHLRVWSTHTWYSRPVNIILIASGLFISLLVFFIMQNNYELRKMKAIFEEMAHLDPVTGIRSRRYMDETLKRTISSLSRSKGILSVLMIDVDHFKNYNDTYGHNKGDTCLRSIAEVLNKSLLRADDLVARYGGEEFIVILPNAGTKGAHMVAERLLEDIRISNILHENSPVANHITVSIGVTTGAVEYPYTGDDFIKQADKAMYMSKQNGRNRYTYLDLLN